MDSLQIIDFVQGTTILLAFIFLMVGLNRWQKNRRGLKGFLTTSSLRGNSPKGSYVKFKGRFSGLEFKSPITKKPCSHWSLVIRAEFQSKKKKPNKGMQTHRPTIYKESSEDQPMLISNGKQLVQMALKNNFTVMNEVNYRKKESYSIPLESLKHLSQAKYKKYISEECWYSPNCEVTVWGYVLERTKNCIILSQLENRLLQPLIFIGSIKDLKNLFSSANHYCLMLILWATVMIMIGLTWMPEKNQLMSFSILGVVVLVVALFLTRKTKANLKGS